MKDANAFATALKLVGGPLFGEPQVRTLRDEEATQHTIAAEFDRLASIVKARDGLCSSWAGTAAPSLERAGSTCRRTWTWRRATPSRRTASAKTSGRPGWPRSRRKRASPCWMPVRPGRAKLSAAATETVMAQLEHATGRNIIAAAPAGKAAYEGYKGHGVLTYAILEALHRPEGVGADTVDVYGLAAHVSRQVPAISQRAFGLRQQPRFTPTGDNFPLGVRAAVLAPVSNDLAIPAAPTHVNTELLKVFKQHGGKGGVALQLPPFTTVTLIKSERGWAHVARDGKALGYVPEVKLQKLAQPTTPDPASTAPAPAQPQPPARPKRVKKPPPVKAADEPASFWKNHRICSRMWRPIRAAPSVA